MPSRKAGKARTEEEREKRERRTELEAVYGFGDGSLKAGMQIGLQVFRYSQQRGASSPLNFTPINVRLSFTTRGLHGTEMTQRLK